MDELILYAFLLIVGLIVLIDKWVSDFKKAAVRDPGRIADDIGALGNYTFNFEDTPSFFPESNPGKEVSGFTKLLLVSLSLLIVFVPLYKMILTLEPVTRYYFMNCLL